MNIKDDSYLYELISHSLSSETILDQMGNIIEKRHYAYQNEVGENAFSLVLIEKRFDLIEAFLNQYVKYLDKASGSQDTLFDISWLNRSIYHAASKLDFEFLTLIINFHAQHPTLIDLNKTQKNENFLHILFCNLESSLSLSEANFLDYLFQKTNYLDFTQFSNYDMNPLDVLMERFFHDEGDMASIVPLFDSLFKYQHQHKIDFNTTIDWGCSLLTLAAAQTEAGSIELMNLFLKHLDLLNIYHVDEKNKNVLANCQSIEMVDTLLNQKEIQNNITFIQKAIRFSENLEVKGYLMSYLEKMQLEKSISKHIHDKQTKTQMKI